VEEPVELTRALREAPPDATVVVDCLSLWVANGGGEEAALEAAAARTALTVAVTNEVGLGIVPDNALARAYRDTLGRVNAAWVAAADEAYFVVAGKTLPLV
jgi:adenosylcobinamide kinase/adenosylcobinamide-phosphate guanylyltransferase